MNKIQSKMEKTNFNFAKNIITSIVVPAILIIATLVIGLVFGYNKGVDFGGINVSVVAENINLEDGKTYNQFKNEIDTILNNNGVCGTVYMVETDSVTYDDVLVVKINYNGAEAEKVVNGIKQGIISKFYADVEEAELENRNLVRVSTYSSSVNSYTIIATILATLVTILAICVYTGLRNLRCHTAVITFMSSVISTVISMAVVMLTRIQINAYLLALIPLCAITSGILTFMFVQKANKLSKTDKYERKNNAILANDIIKSNLYKVSFITLIAVVMALAFVVANITSNILFLGLGILAVILSVVYTNIFIMPALYALSYVRRVKREKTKKENKTDKLEEEEVLKETDLDNLVSN